jgi:hypothetical protein
MAHGGYGSEAAWNQELPDAAAGTFTTKCIFVYIYFILRAIQQTMD